MHASPSSSSRVSPDEALGAWLDNLRPVNTESVSCELASGRVLAEPVLSDRPSPPCDTSAMDGYAVRLCDLAQTQLVIDGDVRIGQPPPVLQPGHALRIVTGAPLPTGAEAVIKREDVRECTDHIELAGGCRHTPLGLNVRHRGENLTASQEVLPVGASITPAVAAALAGFGKTKIAVYRKVRIGIAITGDELIDPPAPIQSWQIYDSNGPALRALLRGIPWVELVRCCGLPDDAAALQRGLSELLDNCDALWITGGVSMGNRDYVPQTIRELGATVVFHRLPIRPGHPILGAVGRKGQLIAGLPGNPVSVLTTARRFALSAVARLAGLQVPGPLSASVTLAGANDKTLDLWWYRPVRLVAAGVAELVANRGSGDFVGAARSSGFVEIPPGMSGKGPWPFYPWTL